MRPLGRIRGRPARGAPILPILLVVLVLSLTSCTKDDEGPDGQSAPGPSPAEVEKARTTIAAADLTDDATIAGVDGLRYTEEGVEASREALEGGATGDELWAATWVYASSGTDPAPLVPLLESDDPSIRLMAAGGLVGLGDVRGFDTLVALLEVDEHVAGSHPPARMWQYVGATLQALTGQDLGPTYDATPEEVAAAAGTWADWLAANRANLSFDSAAGTWSVG